MTQGDTAGKFAQRCGYRIGEGSSSAMNASWPFGLLEVQADRLSLRCIRDSLEFPLKSLVRLSVHRGLFSTGLRIEHTVPEHPAYVVAWVFRHEKLLSELVRAGLPFQVGPKD